MRLVRLALAGLALVVAGPASAQAPAAPGAFDYYVLALSWSPEHCASVAGAADKLECGHTRYGFLVHGLWPQHRAGGWPERCARVGPVPRDVIERNEDVILDEKLLRHQWAKHGTCTGLDIAGYLDRVRAARDAVKLPDDYLAPESAFESDAAGLRAAFAAANPGFPPESIAVKCRGRHLVEVRICLGKGLEPVQCGADVLRDGCGGRAFMVRPLF
jgi:ribonuclease T2